MSLRSVLPACLLTTMIAAEPAPIDVRLDAAQARFADGVLTVDTGRISRSWRVAADGLATTAIRSGTRTWSAASATEADWSWPGIAAGAADVTAIDAAPDDDEGRATRHLRVRVAMRQAAREVELVVWAFPGADGLRQQLRIRGAAGAAAADATKSAARRSESIPVRAAAWRAAGYHNDTQHFKEALLKEEDAAPGALPWASLLWTQDAQGGLMAVEESHRCVNQAGIGGAGWELTADGLRLDAWALQPKDLRADAWRTTFATWLVAWEGGADARELALKRFQRLRQ